ncbi:hypothetical protein TRFO_19704 [Tritrichomonas foetus]|uniref:Uncharacterized protein n=1 Tax=Tritrichomonas foetus TaxID=1144522 RepID=A0A1J4KHN1_9EUKA|nr:hypothetical protein TRFO_19704 [Tritrichomonas foetus]|eukprot:OHT10903.1 hypothetical protein TRFO_19704 [Tritrichomonas foetus]
MSRSATPTTTSRTPTPALQQSIFENETWVDGFTDLFTLIKENKIRAACFLFYILSIAMILLHTHNKNMLSINDINKRAADHPGEYYNGTAWVQNPSSDLVDVYEKVINDIKPKKYIFVEKLAIIAESHGFTLEEVEAAIQIKNEYTIHKYGVAVQINEYQFMNLRPLFDLMIIVFISAYIIYYTSPYYQH